MTSVFKSKTAMHEAIEMEMRVLPNDLDFNLHMTNARFLGILDLALLQILVRSGFFKAMRAVQALPIAGGSLITFRTELQPFAKYRVRLWYLGCSEFWHVFGFAFLRADGRVAAKGLMKGAAVRRGRGLLSCTALWESFSRRTGKPVHPPALPSYALNWLAAEQRVFEMPIREIAEPLSRGAQASCLDADVEVRSR